MTLALPILQDQPMRPAFAQGPASLASVRLLRLSITDRCNLRCLYCMPEEGVPFFNRHDVLSTSDLLAVVRAARAVGVDHFKITGGEPTVRHDLPEITRGIKALKPRDLSLTTNGLLLERQAKQLRAAGLDRLTVSLDTLDPHRFNKITRFRGGRGDGLADGLTKVLHGIEAAESAGFKKLKLNMVVIGGMNDDEVVDFARLTLDHPWTVRFIEYMPLGEATLTDDVDHHTVDNAILRKRIERQWGPLTSPPRQTEAGVGPAEVFTLPGAAGRIGFISAMSQPFCESCNRLRLTARGELRSCLFDGGEVDLLPALKPRPDEPRIIDLMRTCVSLKTEVHSSRGNRAMSQMGG